MNLYRVALSTINNAYLQPFIAVFDPNIMSMCRTPPNFCGSSSGSLFALFLSIVVTSPKSSIGSLSSVVIRKLLDVCCMSLTIDWTFRNPKPFRSWWIKNVEMCGALCMVCLLISIVFV